MKRFIYHHQTHMALLGCMVLVRVWCACVLIQSIVLLFHSRILLPKSNKKYQIFQSNTHRLAILIGHYQGFGYAGILMKKVVCIFSWRSNSWKEVEHDFVWYCASSIRGVVGKKLNMILFGIVHLVFKSQPLKGLICTL